MPAPILERVSRSLACDEHHSRLAVREALRMLFLFSCGGSGARNALSQELDETWHALILETRFYHDLCAAFPSREYIHHSVSSIAKDSEDSWQEAINLLAAYVGAFGPFEERALHFWAGLSDLKNVFKLDLPALNERLAKIHAQGNLTCHKPTLDPACRRS